MKTTNHQMMLDRAFTYHVVDYDIAKREYILQNNNTKEIIRIPKGEYEKMVQEQRGQQGHHEEHGFHKEQHGHDSQHGQHKDQHGHDSQHGQHIDQHGHHDGHHGHH